MKIVTDAQGHSWICLELPGTQPDGTVRAECNNGAARAVITVPEGWADNLPDADILARIEAAKV
jgi:hypothetical protein